jgi:hypothetical protein
LIVVSMNSLPRRVSVHRSASGIVTLIASAVTSTTSSPLMDAIVSRCTFLEIPLQASHRAQAYSPTVPGPVLKVRGIIA